MWFHSEHWFTIGSTHTRLLTVHRFRSWSIGIHRQQNAVQLTDGTLALRLHSGNRNGVSYALTGDVIVSAVATLRLNRKRR